MGFLDARTRGLLDQHIDKIIAQDVPMNLKLFRMPSKKMEYHIQNENDFVFGAAYGSILTGFTALFITFNGRNMTNEEADEALDIIDRRAAEIRNAIFSSG